MTTQVSPTQLASLLDAAFAAQLPLLVVSPPGCGKSDIIASAAKRIGADLIISHPVVEDPTDAKGLPHFDDGRARFAPLGQVAAVLAATRPTIWFIDDLGQAMPSMQAAYMQWLLARECGGHKLPDCVTIVAATNRRSDRAGVTGLLEPVKSRFASIVELVPDNDAWSQWALENGVPLVEVAFLRFRPELLSAFEASADLTNSPMPRTWANVAKLLDLGLDPQLEHIAIAGAVGEGAAAEFMGFKRLFEGLPNIDALLLDPDSEPLSDVPAVLYATVTALGARTTEANFGSITRYAERLMDAGHGEFATVLVRDAMRKEPAVKETAAFVTFATGPFAHLMTGGAAA